MLQACESSWVFPHSSILLNFVVSCDFITFVEQEESHTIAQLRPAWLEGKLLVLSPKSRLQRPNQATGQLLPLPQDLAAGAEAGKDEQERMSRKAPTSKPPGTETPGGFPQIGRCGQGAAVAQGTAMVSEPEMHFKSNRDISTGDFWTTGVQVTQSPLKSFAPKPQVYGAYKLKCRWRLQIKVQMEII